MKKIFRLVIFTIFLTGCSNAYPPQTVTPDVSEQKIEIISTSTETQDVMINQAEQIVEETSTQKTTTTSEIPAEEPEQTTIQEDLKDKNVLIVEGKEYTLPFTENTSVHDMMMTLSAMSSQPFYFETTEFPGMGYFVNSINGKEQDVKKGIYWIYYVNNKTSTVGISNYIIKKGDVIEWKYETSTF
ncbi:hypothetical protein C0581_00285 [Candidatus Parcubacteria bacterium]|nr:MAG: hypothetical protein C0581_00285 [Candidatus Parcubacteria bacterium]